MPRLIPSRAPRGGDPAGDEPDLSPAPRVRPYWLASGTASGARRATGARTASGLRTAGAGAGSRTAPGRTAATGLGVPAFAHPLVAPAEWAELARPGTPLHWTAFDVARGPGVRPDPLYGQVLERVRENAVPILGHLDCLYGARPFGELVTDASHYLDWYRVDGFYLGRAPTLRSEIAECRRLIGTLRALLDQQHGRDRAHGREQVPGRGSESGPGHGAAAAGGGGVRIVLAPGAYPHPDYAETADQLVVFDGPWTRYRWSEAPQWSAAYPAARFAHLVHALPATHLDAALRIARWQGAGTLCMTDRTDRTDRIESGGEDLPGAQAWSGLPAYWTDLVRLLRREQEGAPSM